MIVLGIADRDDVTWVERKLLQRRPHSARLVDARRQNHHRALVEDDLQFEAERTDRLEHVVVVGRDRGDDDAPDRERRDAAPLEKCDERGGRRLGQRHGLAGCRAVNECAVFGDDAVEQVEAREHPAEIAELAAGDEQKLAARPAHLFERRDGSVADDAIGGERAIEVGGERLELHAPC